MEPIKSYLSIEGWKRDLEQTKSHMQTLGKTLYNILDGGASARLKDFIDSIEQREKEYNAQLAQERIYVSDSKLQLENIITFAKPSNEKVVIIRPIKCFMELYSNEI